MEYYIDIYKAWKAIQDMILKKKKQKTKQLSNSSCNVILFFPQKNVIFVCIAVGATMVLLALDKL